MVRIRRLLRDCTGKGIEIWLEGRDGPLFFAQDLVAKMEVVLGYPVVQIDIKNPPALLLTRLDAAVARIAEADALAAKLAVFDEVRAGIEAQIAVQFDKARIYIETHPAATPTQIRSVILSKVQAIFTGDVV